MIAYEKPYQTQAHIHSLNGITVLGEDKQGNQPIYIVEYKGVRCTAIFNYFNFTYYADDKYGRLQ